VKETRYPTLDELVEANRAVLREIRVRKADSARMSSSASLRSIISRAMQTERDVYKTATSLLTDLVRMHPFASGNRTA
jgi:prophage maintenance system killer protein